MQQCTKPHQEDVFMKHYFMDVMGYLSLLIYPYKLSHFFSLLFNARRNSNLLAT